MASSDPAYYNPNFYQKIRQYYNNRMVQTGRPPSKEEIQALMESALNQATVARDASEGRRQNQEQIDMQKDSQKMAMVQSGVNLVGGAANLYMGGKAMGMWGKPAATALATGTSTATPMAQTAAGMAPNAAVSTGTTTAGAGMGSKAMGMLKSAGPAAGIAAGIAANVAFADKNKSKPLFEGQQATDVRQGDIWTEPWLESMVGDEGVTMGRKAGTALKNRDWNSLAARAPAAGMHWTDPGRSAVYEYTKAKWGKTAASLLNPDFGITDFITGGLEDDDSTVGKVLDPFDIF
jgi:hypothetical protein